MASYYGGGDGTPVRGTTTSTLPRPPLPSTPPPRPRPPSLPPLLRLLRLTAIIVVIVVQCSGPVTVLADTTNVALHKPTIQKDTFQDRTADKAVDGDSSTVWEHNKCSRTLTFEKTWWGLDLLYNYTIHNVNIANRKAGKLNDFYIYVSPVNILPMATEESNPSYLCAGPVSHPSTGMETFNCTQPVRGRFVSIWKPGDATKLTLCEVEIFFEEKKLLRKINCASIVYGLKVNLTSPYYAQTMRRVSMASCLVTCLSVNVAAYYSPTHVHVRRDTGLCECFQYSEFSTTSPLGMVPDANYELCTVQPGYY